MEVGEVKERDKFNSSFGMIAASIGSAVGLANIWRFPYITGIYGGGAFIILYLGVVILLGLGLMCVEMVIGRRGEGDGVQSFKNLAPGKKWYFSGVCGIVASFMIMCYYPVVAGWVMEYIVRSGTGVFEGQTTMQLKDMFYEFMNSPIKPILWTVVFMILTTGVVLMGVQKGIERISAIIIPLLIVIVIILDIRALTLPNAKEGIGFLLKPNWSLITPKAVFIAMGHAFFSLSIGLSILTTYGSYMVKKENIVKSCIIIAASDTGIALLAGLAIFPAVFSFGLEPGEGVGLVFVTLPNVFASMTAGRLFGMFFFLLLALAGLTSTISLLEPAVAYLVETRKISRTKSALTVGVAMTLLCILSSLSNGPMPQLSIFGMTFFDIFDYVTTNYLLAIAAIIEVVFIGWFYPKEDFIDEITNGGKIAIPGMKVYFNTIIKFFMPAAMILIFLSSFGIF
ncbi:MAG: sodium-dependent transporter [Tissierellia bacterium]|nr:sodium-dependent transporter [Tissierellia bacterium]